MIIGPWKVNVPLHVCKCTHVHIHPPLISERYTVHINSVFVFQSPFNLNCPLTWLVHSTRFYCALVWGGESSWNPQAGMQAPGLHGVSENLPTFQTSFTKNRVHYNPNHEQQKSNRPTFQKGWVIGFPPFQVKIAWTFYHILGSQNKI